MRKRIPRAVCVLSKQKKLRIREWRGTYRNEPPQVTDSVIQCAVCMPGNTVEIEDYSYFWNTHHRPMNDCVHSKLVDIDGNDSALHGLVTINGDEYIYSDRIVHMGDYCYRPGVPLTDPLDPTWNPNTKIQACPCGIYINDLNQSFYVNISSQTSAGRTPYILYTVTMYMYYGNPDPTPSVPYVAFQATYRCNLGEMSNHGYDWASPTDCTRKSFSRYSGGYTTILRDVDYSKFDHVAQKCFARMDKAYYRKNNSTSWYYWSAAAKRLISTILESGVEFLRSIPAIGRRMKWKNWSTYSYTELDLILPEPVPPEQRFFFHEDDRFVSGLSSFALDNSGLQNYWYNVLVQQSYLDALDSVPRLNDNSISNIIEIAGFIKALLIDHKVEIPKSLGDVWLSYRYQYNTTKLDAEEAISFVHRHLDLGTLDQWIHCFGRSQVDFSNGKFSATVSCRCGLSIRPSDVAMLGKVWRGLYTYGLQPNFYVIWDMIPYSFIIDWLIPIGKLAHATDASSMYDGTYYQIKDVCFSLSYEFYDDYANLYHQYSRWVQDGVPQLNGFYFLEEDPATSKVKGMRILDVLSLFIGRRKT